MNIAFLFLTTLLTTPIFSHAIEYKKIEVSEKETSLLLTRGHAIESPVLSDDGSKLAYIGSKLGEKLPASDLFIMNLDSDEVASTVKKGLTRPLNIFVKGAFTSAGALVACELEYRPGAITRTTIDYFKTKEWEPKGYHSVISFYENNKRVKTYSAREFGLPKGTFLEHPRVSPDQRWLTFYTQSSEKTQGIYLYNFSTRRTFWMGNFSDKHPTWSADGKKIFFHEQGKLKTSGDEIARVGYYRIHYSGEEASLEERVMIGDSSPFGESYVYQKHPAYHEGLNLLFFHARDSADGGKTIGVISLDHPEHAPFLLKMSYQGNKVKGAEHVTVSFQNDSALFFVGKANGVDAHSLMRLDFSALKEIKEKFEK